MKDTIKTACLFIIMVATIGLALNLLFNYNVTTYTKEIDIGNGLKMYTFQLDAYYKNIRTAITDTAELQITMPTRQWQTVEGIEWWNALINDLAVVLDYIILIANVLMYPLRVGAYLLKIVITILGVRYYEITNGNPIHWIRQAIDTIIPFTFNYV